MKEQKRFLKLSEFEWRLLIKCLNEARSLFLDNGKSVEDIDELLIKAFKMKHKKVRNDYFTDIDRQAEEEFEQLVKQMAASEGITEQLKAADQTAWTGKMNSIRNRAAEIVNSEIIFRFE